MDRRNPRSRRPTCFTVEVDGEQVVVRGDPDSLKDEVARQAFIDIVRAAKRRHAREHPEVTDG